MELPQPTYPPSASPFARAILENRDLRFLVFQLLGWVGYGFATFFSITLVDDNANLGHILHIAIQALMGLLCSWPLRWILKPSFARSSQNLG